MNEPFLLLHRATEKGSRLALLQNGLLLEYDESEAGAGSLVGQIRLGTVERVLPAVNAAFVKVGLPLNGFLPLKEQESFHQAQGGAPLVTGRDELVQVKKDPKNEKGAFLTRDVALAGQYALLMPNNRFIGVSKRITSEGDRARARALGSAIAQERFGLIVRYAALEARPRDVIEEAEQLLAKWQEISQRAAYTKAPALLYQPPSEPGMTLRDYVARHPCTLYTNRPMEEQLPEGVTVQQMDETEMEAQWRSLRVENQLEEALRRRVPLKAGGDLVIDEREALHTIDLNSGSHVTAGEEGSLPLTQNLAAVPEIARQIRLRNLSGIILVDFIDMKTDEERLRVRRAMEEAVADDRIKTVVHEFTELGLLELTRKRTRDTLRSLLTDPCKACGESGRRRRQPT